MTRLLLIAVTALLAGRASADVAELNVIPTPRHVSFKSAKRVIPRDTSLKTVVDPSLLSRIGEEGYLLTIDKKGVTARVASQRGGIWARRTLDQIKADGGAYPCVTIEDYPEFPFRGFMYDCGRNWVPVSTLKHYLDIMSRYKLNVFHWHLTDKPAWRIESKAYTRLNDPKFQRQGRDQGKFYTYDEIRDIIAYARERGIEVMPEIDMPGHSDFFRTVFGVGMDSKKGMEVLTECIDEFCREIPADLCPWLHIGSDEVHIADKEGFMRWAQGEVRKHGRKAMAWDPGLPADSLTARQIWRGGMLEEGIENGNYPIVDSSMGYLNIYDPMLLPYKLYFHAMCGTGKASANDLGGILCLWNDVKASDKDKIAPHSGMAGGVIAFAENIWRGAPSVNDDHGVAQTLIKCQGGPDMKHFTAFQSKMKAQRKYFDNGEFDYWQPLTDSEWNMTLWNDTLTITKKVYGDVLDLDAIAAEEGIRPDEMVNCRLTRTVTLSNDTVVGFKIGFDNPARSNRISDGIPAQGQWENQATVQVNGVAIAPPVWEEPECYSFHYHTWARPEEELPYTDEQLYWMRKPTAIPLKKGENTVELTIPRHFNGQHWQASFIQAAD